MDTEGIGTDATIAEHINTILTRKYAIKNDQQRFEPTSIGLALVEGYVIRLLTMRSYVHMGHELYRPYLRAHMEHECKEISKGMLLTLLVNGLGTIHYKEVIRECIGEMKTVFLMVCFLLAVYI